MHQREYAALEQELPSIQEALEMAYTLQMNQELLAGLLDGMPFFQARGLYSMAEHYLWFAWEAVSNQGDPKEQAIVSHNLASTLSKLGNYAQAKELAEQGLVLTGSLDEKQVRSRLLQTLGDIADNEGDAARAEVYYQEGLQLARQTQDTFLVCSLSASYGYKLLNRGQLTQALRYFEEAMQFARQHHYLEELSFVLCRIGVLWEYQGNYAEAERYFYEGVQIAQQLGQRLSAPLLLMTLLTGWGETQLFHSQFDAARQHFQDMFALDAEKQNSSEMLAHAHYGLAQIAFHEKNMGKAREHAVESVRLFKKVGHYKAQEVQAWVQTLPKERTMLPEQEGMAHSGG